MKLIIDIQDDVYKKIIADKYAIYDKMYYSIKNGTPLPKLDKPHIKGDYYDGFKNGLRTAEWRYDKIRAEIEAIIGERNLDDYDFCSGLICARKILDKYKAESEE